MDIYRRYAPFIQDFIYENGWDRLRAVQVAAGDAIFNTNDNVLLCASTASGKTEAAFFPILTLFDEDPPSSVGVIYIGPLKALINDQFLRLSDLCSEAGIPVWHWHGDVSQTHKNKLLKHPSGILQITPESLEALMLHKHADIVRLFHDLRFIVIDEVHSLMRGDRGGQTLCLIERLSRMSGSNPRRIGLSATIGDPRMAGEFLAAGTGRGTIIPELAPPPQEWKLSMEHFYVGAIDAVKAMEKLPEDAPAGGTQAEAPEQAEIEAVTRAEAQAPIQAETEAPSDKAPAAADPGLGYIFEHTRGKKCLVFCNSREEAEMVTTTLRQYCEAVHEPDRFLIHHGNLSAAYRLSAEDAMKDETTTLSTVTTATLELGIDIGRLERAFQIDAPFMVSSFLQRMGRTGRRGQPPEMWFVMREEMPEARDMIPANLPWYLLQGIALVQLYREERFVEPPRLDRLPYSLLYHQAMSILASCGEMLPSELADRLLSLSVFRNISRDDLGKLISHLVKIDHLQTTERGGLIVGLTGERVTNSYKFYAVFQENEEYTVRCESQELGTIVKPPPVGDKVAIAGHVWEVEEIDHRRHTVYCQPVKGNIPAYFGACPGDIHTRILERMAGVLREDTEYPYLKPHAKYRLAEARQLARASGLLNDPLLMLSGSPTSGGIEENSNLWVLFPWLGSYAFLALERLLKLKCAPRLGLKNLDSSRPYFIQFVMKKSRAEFFDVLTEEAEKIADPMELVYPGEVPVFEKYDEYVPAELVRKGFALAVLDMKGMKERVKEWKKYTDT